jgi:hypothetical protein
MASHGPLSLTVEDFWSHYKHVQPPSRLDLAANYHLFKCDIKPMWEDEQNLGGGRWVRSPILSNPRLKHPLIAPLMPSLTNSLHDLVQPTEFHVPPACPALP